MSKLHYQFHIIEAIRKFFNENDFLDVLTPPLVCNPGMEVHIHPLKVQSINPANKDDHKLFLHTSPEFAMKKILADCQDLNNIFTINYSFRDEPVSSIHRKQFIMCEWYRKNEFYTKIMDDCENLIRYCISYLSKKGIKTISSNIIFKRMTVQELFLETINVDILNFLDPKELKKLIIEKFPGVPLPKQDLEWEDYYFLLFLNEVEPKLEKLSYILLYNFPAPLRALSTISNSDKRVCERFEIYMEGIELCNCFNELTDYDEQQERFKKDSTLKKEIYGYELSQPTVILDALKKGIPKTSGIALGVERLLKAITKSNTIFFDEL
jgi:lysyl-tRNA synthetase class 2